jgi:two-component system, LytTR family, sensor kinase
VNFPAYVTSSPHAHFVRNVAARWLLLPLAWLAVMSIFALEITRLAGVPWHTAWIISASEWGPWLVLSPLILWLARRIPITLKTWPRALIVHLAICCLLVLAVELLVSTLNMSGGFSIQPPVMIVGDAAPVTLDVESLNFRLLRRGHLFGPIYGLLVAIGHFFALHRRALDHDRRMALAEARLVEARLLALQSQLNPHFLFNTLNTLTQLVYDNPKLAERTLLALGDLLRAALDAQTRREVPLREELALTDQYLAIQKARFTDRLDVRRDIAPGTLDIPVPALLLQPLVENAVIHGFARGEAPGVLHLRTRLEGGRLLIEIADNGASARGNPDDDGRPLSFKEGVGLGNTRARLAALYGPRQSLILTSAREGGVRVEITLPAVSGAVTA